MIDRAHVIGMGRLGRHLALRLEECGMEVQRWSRTAGPGWASMDGWEEAPAAGAVFLAVPDDDIAGVAARISRSLSPACLLVHHAGSVPIEVLPVEPARRAVMWPPMTFGTDRAPDWAKMPMIVEAENAQWLALATLIAPQAQRLSGPARHALHLGAVLAGNLSAAWLGVVERFLEEQDLSLSPLRPLVEESVQKALEGRALETVSGPASRGDLATLQAQLDTLNPAGADTGELPRLYRILTDTILREHGHPPLPPLQAAAGED